MSIIAKLMVRSVVNFGTGSFVEMSCIADNDLMAAYATKNEDKLFCRYSPWGEIRLNQRSNWAVFVKDEQHVEPPGYKAFYAVMVPTDQVSDETFEGASAFVKINCYCKAGYAQDGSRVELREIYGWSKSAADDYSSRRNVIEKLSWKMHVDNPPAEAQFVPGTDYWLAFYDADKFDMNAALIATHGRA